MNRQKTPAAKPPEPMTERLANRVGRKYGFSKEKVIDFHDTFCLFDKNGDGNITKEELSTVLFKLGQRPTPREVKNMIQSVDVDKSGTIDFEEFLQIFKQKLCVDPEKELREVFGIFDQNKDGFISADELYDVLTKLGILTTKEETKEMVKEADLNSDGKVDYIEFKTILNSK